MAHKHRNGISAALAWVIFAMIRMVSATLRYRWNDRSGYITAPVRRPAIYCVWHNRLALCMPAYFRLCQKTQRTPGMAAMVSASKDGGFLTGILECFKRAAGARFIQPARAAGIARTDDLGGTRLRPCHHAGRPARTALRRAGRRDVAGAATGLPIVPVSYSCELENSREKLGPFSNPAAIFAL